MNERRMFLVGRRTRRTTTVLVVWPKPTAASGLAAGPWLLRAVVSPN